MLASHPPPRGHGDLWISFFTSHTWKQLQWNDKQEILFKNIQNEPRNSSMGFLTAEWEKTSPIPYKSSNTDLN